MDDKIDINKDDVNRWIMQIQTTRKITCLFTQGFIAAPFDIAEKSIAESEKGVTCQL